MPTYLENLKTRRDAIATELAALDSSKAGGKPNVVGGVGSNIDHQKYKDGLVDELERLQALIDKAAEQAQADEIATEGPWVHRS